MDPALAPCNQGLEDLFIWQAYGIGCVGALEVIFIIFVECFFAGDTGLGYKPHCIRFSCHFESPGSLYAILSTLSSMNLSERVMLIKNGRYHYGQE
jgi:hypothetical protein